MIADSVGFVVDRGRETVYDAEHFFDGYKADRDYALATLRAARQAGARTLVLCDTNGGTLTDELTRIVGRRHVRRSTADPDAPAVVWGIHTHNDAELAVANSMAAVAAGIRHVQATINGYGERAGNANMVSILANLALKTPHVLVPAGGGRLDGLTELSRSVAEIANLTPERLPAVRRSVGVRAQGRGPRRGRGQGRAVVPARRAGVGRERRVGWSSRSSAGGPTPRSGPSSSGTSSRAWSMPASSRSSSSSWSRTGWPSRAPRRRSSCSSAARRPTTRRRSGSSTTRASSSSATAASCWPRRRSRSRSTARRCTRPRTGTARSTRSMPPCARPSGRSTRRSTTSTSSTTRCASSTATRRRPPGRGSIIDSQRRRADVVHDGQRHEHHRGVGVGPGRFARVRDLEVRRGAAPPRRTPLHDGDRRGRGAGRRPSTLPQRPGGSQDAGTDDRDARPCSWPAGR